MGIAEQIYLTIHIQRVVSEKKHPIIRIVTVWQAKPGLKIGSRMFVTVFQSGFYFK